MNNGRPNQGNTSAWGQTNQQGYTQRQGAQQGYQQPYQQNQQPYRQPGFQQGYQPQPYQQPQQGYQRPPYQQAPYQQNQQPYQQGFQQPNYSAVNQAPYQQGYRPQQQRQQQAQPQQTYYGHAYPQPPYQQQFQQPPYQQGQPYPGYPQQNPYGQPPVQQPQQKPGFDPAVLLWVMLCGVLPVLFVLGLVLANVPVIKWVFVGLAVATVAVMWIKPVLSSNMRLTFSGVYAALAVVALVSALTAAPTDRTAANQQNAANNNLAGGQAAQQQQQQPAASGASLGDWTTEVPAPQKTPEPDQLQSAAVEQMESFFYFWSVNNQDNMLTLCAPSWRKSVSEPKVSLFSILANRIPTEWTAEKITGTDNDTARTVTVSAMIDKRNGKAPAKYRFQVIMRKEDGQWYVEPASLESHEKAATETPTANETPTPTMEFIASPNTVLYYNDKGGERYHLDAYCKSANEKFLPFKGQFTYSQLNEDAYKELVACNVCGAPLRNQ